MKKKLPSATKSKSAKKTVTKKTASKKPSTRVTKEGAVKIWKGTYDEMTSLVREAFGFLESRYKMKYSRNVTPPECAYFYDNSENDVTLSINSEYSCAPWLVFNVGSHAYRMDRLIRELAPEIVSLEPKLTSKYPSAKDIRALLHYYSKFLRKYGKPILKGDEDFFASIRKGKSKKK